jgi:D-glycero-alpha-D-manno-heptose 1-phosphate guanylyltransferase
MDAIILAGGFGTRIKELFPDIPKPLIPINEVPFLDLLIKQLSLLKWIDRVILAVGYKAECIQEHYQKRKPHLPIEFSIEIKPLGTGGALKQAFKKVLSDQVLVLNGDSYLEFELQKLKEKHLEMSADATLGFIKVNNTKRFGALDIDEENGKVNRFEEKNVEISHGYINGGIYLFKKMLFQEYIIPEQSFSLEKDLFPLVASRGKLFGVLCDKTFIDIGTKDSYLQAQTQLRYLTDDY